MTTTKKTSNLTMNIPPSEEQVKQQLSKTNDNSNPQQGSSALGTLTPLKGNRTDMTPVKPQAEAVPGRTNMMKSPPTKKDSRKLFVGGLPSDVVESEFREFFEQFGEVLDSVVMFDRETRRSRGFGFVTFRDPEVAETLLNTRQDEEATEGEGVSGETENGQRVGRLVMRGKTCEVKAAEPKEASRSARRGYQNQGFGGGAPTRRYVDKAYINPGGDRQATAAFVGAYHDPHYIAGHQYQMMSPSYYPAYHHPGVYAGGGYHPAAMYAPMGPAAAVPVHGERHQPVVPQPVVPPHAVPHMEGGPVPYTEATYQEAGDGHHYAYGHPYDMIQPSYPANAGAQIGPKQGQHYASNYVVSGTSSSVMHPAAPGIPSKDEK